MSVYCGCVLSYGFQYANSHFVFQIMALCHLCCIYFFQLLIFTYYHIHFVGLIFTCCDLIFLDFIQQKMRVKLYFLAGGEPVLPAPIMNYSFPMELKYGVFFSHCWSIWSISMLIPPYLDYGSFIACFIICCAWFHSLFLFF